MKNINLKKLSLILIFSSTIGLTFNYFNPDGISLIRQQRKLNWADERHIKMQDTANTVESNFDVKTNEKSDSLISNILSPEVPLTDTPESKYSEINKTESDFSLLEFNYDQPLLIDLEQAKWLYSKGAVFIDARDSLDYARGHINNALNLPYYQFNKFEYQLDFINKDQNIVTYCDGSDCDLSIMLGDKLFNSGYKKVFVFYGGWEQWQNAGLPINIPENTDD